VSFYTGPTHRQGHPSKLNFPIMSTPATPSEAPHEFVAGPEDVGKRLDVFLTEKLPAHSRVQLRRIIVGGHVKVDGLGRKVAYKLVGGERVMVQLPEMPTAGALPENIPLDVLYEDEHLLAVNKPPFMVVHPARGHWSGTLASALAFHFDQLSTAGGPTRPGIVHRLDRDTSGVMVIAKTDQIHFAIAAQFEQRETEKEYFALVLGEPDRDRDWISQPIGPHPYQREKMAIRPGHPDAREATTFYEVVERFNGFAALKVFPKTGRTHQIRVHLAHIRHSVLCDRLYGGRAQITQGEIEKRREDDVVILDRQALHARRLKIRHPITGQPLEFEAPILPDIQRALDELRAFRKK
jgi:23S rRNA pseudouridine1911/1915/1917 synthase